MKKLVYFLMVGLAFTATQVAHGDPMKELPSVLADVSSVQNAPNGNLTRMQDTQEYHPDANIASQDDTKASSPNAQGVPPTVAITPVDSFKGEVEKGGGDARTSPTGEERLSTPEVSDTCCEIGNSGMCHPDFC